MPEKHKSEINKKSKESLEKETAKAILEYGIVTIMPVRELTLYICVVESLIRENNAIPESQKSGLGKTIEFLRRRKGEEIEKATLKWTGTVAELMPTPAECARIIEANFLDIDKSSGEAKAILNNLDTRNPLLKQGLSALLNTKWLADLSLISGIITNEDYPLEYRLPLVRALIYVESGDAAKIKQIINRGGLGKLPSEILETTELNIYLQLLVHYEFLMNESKNAVEAYHAQEKINEIRENIRWLSDRLGVRVTAQAKLQEGLQDIPTDEDDRLQKSLKEILDERMSSHKRFAHLEQNLIRFTSIMMDLHKNPPERQSGEDNITWLLRSHYQDPNN